MDAFIGNIVPFAFGLVPRGWAACNGQTLPINSNQALFALLGTQYGGDGRTNFGLPNLNGRVPMHVGNSFTQGQSGGEEMHVLTAGEMPNHTHPVNVNSSGSTSTDAPAGNFLGHAAGNTYGPATALVAGGAQMGGAMGQGGAHENRQPFTVVNFCICTSGIFPSRN